MEPRLHPEPARAPRADRHGQRQRLTEDEEGVWLSGYAPVYSRNGTAVGAVGLDLPADHLRQRQRELLELLAVSSVAALAVALLVGLYLANAVARPVQHLAELSQLLAGGDLRIDVECLDAVLTDLSERWPARIAPTHLADGAEPA